MLTRTDTALNVNRFVESVCGLQTLPLRTNSKAAANIRLKEKQNELAKGKSQIQKHKKIKP